VSYTSCDVCERSGLTVRVAGQQLCSECAFIAVEYSPAAVIARARQFRANGEHREADEQERIANWLGSFAGAPSPRELPRR
jgi:hypothetical protein